MRWKNGGPKKIYVLITQDYGEIFAFDRKRDRDDFTKDEFQKDKIPTVKLTYIQKEG
jgi:hypothetical protein